MSKFLKKYAFLFSVAGIIILLDQWTKTLIRQNLEIGEVMPIADWLTPYARFVHWNNTGVSFGMLQGSNDLFKILILAVVAGIIYVYPRVPEHDKVLRLALAMELGGATGNLIDRFTVGHVTDFISVGKFPVFNIADASITVGVGVLILGYWFAERDLRRNQRVEGQPVAAVPGDPSPQPEDTIGRE